MFWIVLSDNPHLSQNYTYFKKLYSLFFWKSGLLDRSKAIISISFKFLTTILQMECWYKNYGNWFRRGWSARFKKGGMCLSQFLSNAAHQPHPTAWPIKKNLNQNMKLNYCIVVQLKTQIWKCSLGMATSSNNSFSRRLLSIFQIPTGFMRDCYGGLISNLRFN